MMKIQTGQIIQSHSTSADDYFYKAIVCVTEHNTGGSVGFVVNRLFPRTLNELEEFARLRPFPLYEGGPVDQSHLYFIHRRPDIIESGNTVSAGLYFGGDFKQVIQAIAGGSISHNDIRIFVGYCGWDAGELQQEIERAEWSLTDFDLFS